MAMQNSNPYMNRDQQLPPGLVAPSTTGNVANPVSGTDVGTWFLGGNNQRGFLGGGTFRPNPMAFALPNYQQLVSAYGQGFGQLQGQTPWQQQQGQLAQNLFGTINGQTPSVAEQQLQRTTQGNIANAYAMAAAANNPAAARTAADNAASANQMATGQGVELRAQEIQNAQGQLGNVLNQGQQGYLGQQQLGLGYLGGLGNVSGTQLGANIQGQQMAQQAFNNTQSLGPGLMQMAGTAVGAAMGNPFAGMGMAGGGGGGSGGGGSQYEGYSQAPQMLAHGGLADAYLQGGKVPGYAQGGDRDSNDTVRAMLSPGEIVLPRHVTLAEDAPEKAAQFVREIRKAKMGKVKKAA